MTRYAADHDELTGGKWVPDGLIQRWVADPSPRNTPSRRLPAERSTEEGAAA